MPWWMRYVKQEEADDGAGLGNSTGGAADGGAAAGAPGAPAGEAAGTIDLEAGMRAAIQAKLTPDVPLPGDEPAPAGDGSRGVTERVRDPISGRFVEKPAAEATPQAAAAPKADGKQPTAQAGKQPAAVVDPTKPAAPKKADDFALKADEKTSLTPNAQRRVHEIHKEWKTAEAQWETERTTLAQHNQQLTQARESIMGVLEETKTTPEHLTALLHYNSLVQSGNIDAAIQVIEAQRAELYRMAGKEAPGVDLLKDHADLAARVANNEIHRDDAVTIANSRAREQRAQEQSRQQSQQQQQVQSIKTQQDSAMTAIDRWSQEMSQKDIDWAGKEAKIIAKLDGIVKRYPANLWLQRLQEEYESTPAAAPQPQQQQQQQQQRSPAVPGTGGNTPLRASGARGGAPQAATMEEAIARGLGYTPA